MKLVDLVTYWAPPANDFDMPQAPKQYLAHRRDDGIVCDFDPALHGWLLVGDSKERDPSQVSGAMKILEVHPITNLRALKQQHIAIVQS